MRALVYEGNKTLTVREVPVPDINQGEVLIRVSYTGICGSDLLIWNGGYPRVKPPVTIGHEFSGVIEKVGDPNSSFKVGDRVVVEPLITCGKCKDCVSGNYNLCQSLNLIGMDRDGGMAEYVKVSEKKLFRVPEGVSMEDAALIEPLSVCVHMVKKSKVQPGQTALIAGGGPIGLIVAHLAKVKGANVFVSEINPFRISKARELGFNVINPKEENVAEKISTFTNGEGANVSFEVTGTQFGLSDCLESAGTNGIVVIAGMAKTSPPTNTYKILVKELKLVGSRVYTSSDYEEAINLMESGKFKSSDFITQIISLKDAVEHGFESIEKGDPVVKVLINMEKED